MRNSITADRIANAIRMNTTPGQVHLVVEGKLDSQIYPKFFEQKFLVIHCANGYESIFDVFEKVSVDNALGLIDADFRRIDNEIIIDKRIIMTDYHDLEVMILESNATKNFEESFIDNKEKITNVLGTETLLDHAKKQGKVLGILRYMNFSSEDNFGLRFTDLNYSKMIKEENQRLIDLVIDCSKRNNKSVTFNKEKIARISEKFQIISEKEIEDLQLLNGHDLVNLLLHSINKVLKKSNSKIKFYDEMHLMKTICLSYTASQEFRTTLMFHKMETYFKENNMEYLLK
ncbi:hypothetical protein ACI1UN_05870 [Lactococcus petauri]|uniref:hypothetical protein n=1 Tax=Lactococcus petauri TaxID=1940789 RepID=UPI0038543459